MTEHVGTLMPGKNLSTRQTYTDNVVDSGWAGQTFMRRMLLNEYASGRANGPRLLQIIDKGLANVLK